MAHSHILAPALCIGLLLHTPMQSYTNEDLENKHLTLTLDAYNSQLRINELTHTPSATAREVFNKAKIQALNLLSIAHKANQ